MIRDVIIRRLSIMWNRKSLFCLGFLVDAFEIRKRYARRFGFVVGSFSLCALRFLLSILHMAISFVEIRKKLLFVTTFPLNTHKHTHTEELYKKRSPLQEKHGQGAVISLWTGTRDAQDGKFKQLELTLM